MQKIKTITVKENPTHATKLALALIITQASEYFMLCTSWDANYNTMLKYNPNIPSHSKKNHEKLWDNMGELTPKTLEMEMQLELQQTSALHN